MPAKEHVVDLASLDLTQVVSDKETVRQYIPQRFEMEQLSGVVYEDVEKHICVGWLDVVGNEFWTRGHMPGFPLMPGVLMCEAAAQLATYYTTKHDLLGLDGNQVLGFGGLENVRFRGMVRPGDKIYIACILTRIRRGAIAVCRFEILHADGALVCEGVLKGVVLPLQDPASTT